MKKKNVIIAVVAGWIIYSLVIPLFNLEGLSFTLNFLLRVGVISICMGMSYIAAVLVSKLVCTGVQE